VEVEIVATDLNPAAVDRAQMGEFPQRRMSGLTPERIGRFFDPIDGGFRVKPTLGRRIRFGTHNLADPDWGELGQPAGFDLILCRNVIIYFGVETIRRVMDHFHDALRPEGYLFLGYSESLFKVYDRFRMVEVDAAFVYRHLTAEHAPRKVSPRPQIRPELVALRPPVVVSGGPAAVEVVETLAMQPPPRSPSERLAEISAEIERGGFSDAQTQLEAWVAQDGDQLPALLTLGNLFGLTGAPDRARECFERVLSREPLCVDAHVFRATAAFQAASLQEARVELTRAIFLEPSLALAHYLLAQVDEREGHLNSARRSYRNAISQLRTPQRPLAGYYPDLPEPEAIERAARYALSALEDRPER
jgi:chemotaxis protein methyltransferase CheR